jgi:nucleoside-diphosphate-sugar epimerase
MNKTVLVTGSFGYIGNALTQRLLNEGYNVIGIDNEIREADEQGGVFLHHSRVPLAEANIDYDESAEKVQQCTLGMCFI